MDGDENKIERKEEKTSADYADYADKRKDKEEE